MAWGWEQRSGSPATVELSFPARREYLALARSVVAEAVHVGGALSGARLDDVRLVVTEAVANAVDAATRQRQRLAATGQPAPDPAVVALALWLGPQGVRVAVHDDEGGFDPSLAREAPDAASPGRLDHERGLGIPLMRALADRVEFRPAGTGTTVTLWIER